MWLALRLGNKKRPDINFISFFTSTQVCYSIHNLNTFKWKGKS
uniref:Uncharacterized protein n=1 Tax=Anguilla anguilla TaxID=7936 RepID=A0A0E9SRC7_ANGAN